MLLTLSLVGLFGLLIAFAAIAVSIVCLSAAHFLLKKPGNEAGETLQWGGQVAAILAFVALTLCCGILVYAFLTGDISLKYVVENQSHQTGFIGILYKISGLWEGKEGSLLFWAWLISLFNLLVAAKGIKSGKKIDAAALCMAELVLIGFVGILLFSESNMPFTALDAKYVDANGNLTGAAALWGMNSLLEHWAMAVHPPALFTGYAGLTIPFAYAMAALLTNDAGDAWVRRSQRYVMVSWLFLGIGIGLGSVWAYVVLGWGGYWGWDAVENASLLPWLVGVALIHSLTIYRRRGAFKRWAILCACLTFMFCILGTFITRSGLIESVHAFSGDPVALWLFGALIILSVVGTVLGLLVRWKTFAPANEDDEAIENMMSRDAAYYFNNVIMVVFAFLLAYLTVASALPSFLPFGGQALSAGTYNAVARPLGVLYLAVLALCPLLGWSKTDKADFLANAKIPALCAAVLFAGLLVYFFTTLSPIYDATIAAGGTSATGLASEGPAFYYKGLAIVAFAVASLIFFNTLFLIVRTLSAYKKSHNVGWGTTLVKSVTTQANRYGGYVAHLGMAVILVGLVGSSMFVLQHADYVAYDEASDSANDFTIRDYTLKYTGNVITEADTGEDIYYEVGFDVYRGDVMVGHIDPAIQLKTTTQQTKSIAGVLSFPTEDLFVVYRGVNDEGAFSIDVRVNPLISCVWVGFGMLMIGCCVAALGGRGKRKPAVKPADEAPLSEAVE